MPGLWNIIIPVLSTLLGIGVGAWATYLTTSKIEAQKWKQQKKDKYLEDRREALKLLLDFIDPIDRSISKASMLASPFRPTYPGQNLREWQQRWPDLQAELAKMDLRPASRYLLPEGLYGGANPIINLLDEIYVVRTRLTEELEILRTEKSNAKHNARFAELRDELLNKLGDLAQMADQYRKDLRKEYAATYE